MIVVDASVAAKWVLPNEGRTEAALSLLGQMLGTDERMIAPTLLAFEITNIVHQRVRRGFLAADEATVPLDDFFSLPIVFSSPSGLHHLALALAAEFGLPAAYDAHYLALAELADCDLWTDDRRLMRQVGDRFPSVRWLGDYLPEQPR